MIVLLDNGVRNVTRNAQKTVMNRHAIRYQVFAHKTAYPASSHLIVTSLVLDIVQVKYVTETMGSVLHHVQMVIIMILVILHAQLRTVRPLVIGLLANAMLVVSMAFMDCYVKKNAVQVVTRVVIKLLAAALVVNQVWLVVSVIKV